MVPETWRMAFAWANEAPIATAKNILKTTIFLAARTENLGNIIL